MIQNQTLQQQQHNVQQALHSAHQFFHQFNEIHTKLVNAKFHIFSYLSEHGTDDGVKQLSLKLQQKYGVLADQVETLQGTLNDCTQDLHLLNGLLHNLNYAEIMKQAKQMRNYPGQPFSSSYAFGCWGHSVYPQPGVYQQPFCPTGTQAPQTDFDAYLQKSAQNVSSACPTREHRYNPFLFRQMTPEEHGNMLFQGVVEDWTIHVHPWGYHVIGNSEESQGQEINIKVQEILRDQIDINTLWVAESPVSFKYYKLVLNTYGNNKGLAKLSFFKDVIDIEKLAMEIGFAYEEKNLGSTIFEFDARDIFLLENCLKDNSPSYTKADLLIRGFRGHNLQSRILLNFDQVLPGRVKECEEESFPAGFTSCDKQQNPEEAK